MTTRSTVRWGVVGTNAVAGKFTRELRRIAGAELGAVASRSEARARDFARAHGFARAHAGIQTLLDDAELDIVYIATPSRLHREHCLLALERGRPVLCEKPMATRAADAQAIFEAARERKLFSMEAMWLRFDPLVNRLRERIRAGELGEIQHLQATLGWRKGEERVDDPAKGRGALLDFGVYPLSLAHFLLGEPGNVSFSVRRHASGGDETASMLLEYENGATAALTASVCAELDNRATVYGTKRTALLGSPLFAPRWLDVVAHPSGTRSFFSRARSAAHRLFSRGKASRTTGFGREAEEAMRCLLAGKLESDVVPHEATLSVLRCVDRVRNR